MSINLIASQSKWINQTWCEWRYWSVSYLEWITGNSVEIRKLYRRNNRNYTIFTKMRLLFILFLLIVAFDVQFVHTFSWKFGERFDFFREFVNFSISNVVWSIVTLTSRHHVKYVVLNSTLIYVYLIFRWYFPIQFRYSFNFNFQKEEVMLK